MTSNQEFLQGTCIVEMLLVRIDGNGDSPFNPKMGDSIECIVS